MTLEEPVTTPPATPRLDTERRPHRPGATSPQRFVRLRPLLVVAVLVGAVCGIRAVNGGFIDLAVYRFGGVAVLDGTLYSQGTPGSGLPFTYPPQSCTPRARTGNDAGPDHRSGYHVGGPDAVATLTDGGGGAGRRHRLARGELGVEMHDRRAAFRLRQHDAVGLPRQQRAT